MRRLNEEQWGGSFPYEGDAVSVPSFRAVRVGTVSYGDLQLARLACVALITGILIAAFGDSANWWRIEKTIASLWWLGVLGFALLYIFLGDRMPAAREREQAEMAQRRKEKQQKEAAATVERYRLQQEAREKALVIARADYPQHLDTDVLGARGWNDDYDNVDMISAYLDPPEIVLKYDIPESNDEEEIRLYDRARVEAAEADPEVQDHIRTVLSDREHAAEAKREEEERARLEAEDAAAEEEKKREQERRLAVQKVIRIDDRLK